MEAQTGFDRALEAWEIVGRVRRAKGRTVSPRDAFFVAKILDKLQQFGEKTYISDKQLAWLRDIDRKVR